MLHFFIRFFGSGLFIGSAIASIVWACVFIKMGRFGLAHKFYLKLPLQNESIHVLYKRDVIELSNKEDLEPVCTVTVIKDRHIRIKFRAQEEMITPEDLEFLRVSKDIPV